MHSWPGNLTFEKYTEFACIAMGFQLFCDFWFMSCIPTWHGLDCPPVVVIVGDLFLSTGYRHLRMYDIVRHKKCQNFRLMPWFSNNKSNCSRNRYSITLHTAEKHHPTMFHTDTVRPKRSGPNILYNTTLKIAGEPSRELLFHAEANLDAEANLVGLFYHSAKL